LRDIMAKSFSRHSDISLTAATGTTVSRLRKNEVVIMSNSSPSGLACLRERAMSGTFMKP